MDTKSKYAGPSKKVIGRFDDQTDPRAETEPGPCVTIDFRGAAEGSASAQIFRSTDNMDRGGIILKLEIKNYASSFIPHAQLTPDGVEVHIAGDAESTALLQALKGLVAVLSHGS